MVARVAARMTLIDVVNWAQHCWNGWWCSEFDVVETRGRGRWGCTKLAELVVAGGVWMGYVAEGMAGPSPTWLTPFLQRRSDC